MSTCFNVFLFFQYISSRRAPLLFPPLHLPPAPKLHCPSPASIDTTQALPSVVVEPTVNLQWLPDERKTQMKNQPDGMLQTGTKDNLFNTGNS